MPRRISAELNVALRFDPDADDLDDADAEIWSWYRNLEWSAEIERAVFDQLGLQHGWDDTPYGFVDRAIDELEAVMRQGPPKGQEKRAPEIVQVLVADYTLPELVALMKAFGWRNERIPETKICDLAKQVRKMLAAHLEPAVHDLLVRWDSLGLLDLKGRHKRQPRYRTEARRERSQPLFDPRARGLA